MKSYMLFFMSLTSAIHAAGSTIVSPEAVRTVLATIEEIAKNTERWSKALPLVGQGGRPVRDISEAYETAFVMATRYLREIAQTYGIVDDMNRAVPYAARFFVDPDPYVHRHSVEDQLRYIRRKARWLGDALVQEQVPVDRYNKLQLMILHLRNASDFFRERVGLDT